MKTIEQTQQKLILKHTPVSAGVGFVCLIVSLALWVSLIIIYPSSARLLCLKSTSHVVNCELERSSYVDLREKVEVDHLLEVTAIKKPAKNGERYRIILKTKNEEIELLPFALGNYLENQREANKINDFINKNTSEKMSFYYSDPIIYHIFLPSLVTIFSFIILIQTIVKILDFDKVSGELSIQSKGVFKQEKSKFLLDNIIDIQVLQNPKKRRRGVNHTVLLYFKNGESLPLFPEFSLERSDAVKLKKLLQDFLTIS
jgi:hypothetical protein